MLQLQYYSHGEKSIISDELLMASTFYLPTFGMVDFFVSKEDKVASLKCFYSPGEELAPSCFKKFMIMEYQVLADIVAKAVLVKDGTLHLITKENIQVMYTITSKSKDQLGCCYFQKFV